MPAVQTTFANDFAQGFPGMVANGETSNRISRTQEDAAAIPFGRAVFRGAGAHGCTQTIAAGTHLGITIADRGQVALASADADKYTQYKNVAIMQAGVIWVTAGGTITAGQGIAVLDANGNFVATGTASSTDLTGWKAVDAGTSGSLIRIANRI